MTRRSRLLALVLTAGLAAGAYQLVTPGAGAAEPFSRFDRTTVAVNDRNPQATGRAHVRGSVTWEGKSLLSYVGYIDDLCYGTAVNDGYGAYFEGDVVFMDGTRFPIDGAQDLRGCTAPAKAIPRRFVTTSKIIRRVDFALRERNAAGRLGQTVLWSVDNPLTG
jgi:hypothetical protein